MPHRPLRSSSYDSLFPEGRPRRPATKQSIETSTSESDMKNATSSLVWKNIVRGSVLLALAPTLFALTPQETVSLQYMRQEEKLAHDVYQALAARWQHPTFTRIAAAEQRHIDALSNLLRRHAVTDPTPSDPGQFTFPELKALHDSLVAEGQTSLEAALQVGLKIEETDIADLKEAMQAMEEPDLLRAFAHLSAASERHLNAFTIALEDPTSTAPVCQGAGNCPQAGAGNGMGKGPGKGQGAACGTRGSQGGRRQGNGPGVGAEGPCALGNGGAPGNVRSGTCRSSDVGHPVSAPGTPPTESPAKRVRAGSR